MLSMPSIRLSRPSAGQILLPKDRPRWQTICSFEEQDACGNARCHRTKDGFYYLTAWNEAHNALSEYRLDRMMDLRVLGKRAAARNSEIAGFRYDENKAIMFGRFGGEEVVAILAADADKVEIITDRFGSAATFLKSNDQEALARVKICKSEQFFGWIASMGKKVRIAGPESLVEEYHAYLNHLLED